MRHIRSIARPHVVVIGAGWAGCAAAVSAAAAGARVTLLERTDMILGTGLVGGIIKNNGRFTALEELRAMGADLLLGAMESCVLHEGISFPGHKHASLYDVTRIEPTIRELIAAMDIDLRLRSTCIGFTQEAGWVTRAHLQYGEVVEGHAYIDATGTAGPAANCRTHRSGCVMCVLRCPTFGPRISPTRSTGVNEAPAGLTAATSGSVEVLKESLASDIASELQALGHVEIPLPKTVQIDVLPHEKSCQQYSSKAFYDNLVVLHNGAAKVMVSYLPLELLRSIPGLAKAKYIDPYSAGIGNSVRFNLITPHDKALRVIGLNNLFCAGEKVGLVVGHIEAILTGMLAGHNAVRVGLRAELLQLPTSLMCGDFLEYVANDLKENRSLQNKYTFSGSVYFQHAVKQGLYTVDIAAIQTRVKESGLTGIFRSRLVGS